MKDPVFIFALFVLLSGVLGDEVMLVMEGENITLHTDVIKQKEDKIMWYYGPENTFLARMNEKDISTIYSDDERFKDKLKLDDQTGDLTITHITTQHNGEYKVKISINKRNSFKTFNLKVYGNNSISLSLYGSITKQNPNLNAEVCHKCSDSPPLWIILTSVGFVLLIVIFIIVCIHRKWHHQAGDVETVYTPVTDKGDSMPSSSSSEDSNSSKLPNEKNDMQKN